MWAQNTTWQGVSYKERSGPLNGVVHASPPSFTRRLTNPLFIEVEALYSRPSRVLSPASLPTTWVNFWSWYRYCKLSIKSILQNRAPTIHLHLMWMQKALSTYHRDSEFNDDAEKGKRTWHGTMALYAPMQIIHSSNRIQSPLVVEMLRKAGGGELHAMG